MTKRNPGADASAIVAAALVALARDDVPTDTQELLVYGDPRIKVRPGALSRAAEAAAQQEREHIIACICSTTWSGWHEIVEMIRRRSPRRAVGENAPQEGIDAV